jgi:predicted kinase
VVYTYCTDTSMRTIILLCGIPGSGKSTFVMDYKKKGFTILCPDVYRLVITGQEYYSPAEDIVWAHVKTTARTLLVSDQNVIIDATMLTKRSREEWIRIGDEFEAQKEVITFVTKEEICRERNMNRSRIVPDGVLAGQIHKFCVPSIVEGFDKISFVDLDKQIPVVVGSIVKDPASSKSEMFGRCYNGNPYLTD